MDHKDLAFSAIILLLGFFLIYALYPFLSAIFGAIILYVIFSKLQQWFVSKGISKNISAAIIILLTLIIVLIPVFVITPKIITDVNQLLQQKDTIQNALAEYDQKIPYIDISQEINDAIVGIISYTKQQLVSFASSATNILIGMIIMYITFFYMLVNAGKMEEFILQYSPLKPTHTKRLVKEFENVSWATIVSTGVIAVIQGVLLAISFTIFGIQGALFWGVIGALVSFIPFLGTPLIWIPAAIFAFINGSIWVAIGLVITGIFISTIDNVIRPIISRKVGNIHPLVSVIGVFMGLPLFGFIGVFIGPLLLSYFLLLIRIYQESS